MKRNKAKQCLFEELRKVFYYSEDSKTYLKHKVDKRGGIYGQVLLALKDTDAGRICPNGYASVKYKDIEMRAHRVIYCICHQVDVDPELVIDHIDRNKLNNNINNLRLVSTSDNIKNKIHKESNTSYQNISESTVRMVFQVSFRDNKRKVSRFFSYNPRGHKNSGNWFLNRDEAFHAALDYRNSLVAGGKITITGK